ncbi:PREDICTED: rabankyrin-5-like [Nicrophorus vespilloides]|uniref:Rabankyrin-5-like n=1 Tax=Nicrophorus vespilloides TaxID=110193 RepID=A0ABM1NHT3_NICVS|nr:PREDICTED: rabankyrin-5-like [Nicrophorus vespilloides]
MAQTEVNKLQQHLSLLKDQYSKLQSKYNEIEKKYYNISASNGIDGIEDESTFAARLLNTVASLYDSKTYSDVEINLKDKSIACHKLVLSARSEIFNEESLKGTRLDWSHMESDVAENIVKWLYTNEIHFMDNNLTLKIIRQAHQFKLGVLVESCEQILINNVDIRSCVKFYSVAEEIEAKNLREYCSGLISTHWNDLNSSDFEHMSGPLLYKMLKNKTQLPLHSAVRLQREDVVFLCLVENASRLSDIVNVWSPNGELPLDMALRCHNGSIAKTLVEHNADIDIRDAAGETLLHRSIKQDDSFSALFLLESKCDATLTTRNENESALHLIAGTNNIEDAIKIAEKLINRNANLNGQNRHGYTALHISIISDNRPVFELLLKQPTLDINLRTSQEHTPLYYAMKKYECGEDSYALGLLDHDVQSNPVYSDTCDNLLQVLLLDGANDAALFLLDHTQNYNHANAEGESILHTACSKNSSTFVSKLLELGANPNVLTNVSRRAALHYAVLANAKTCIETFIAFNSSEKMTSVNFNVRDSEGDTPLSLSLQVGNMELVPILIRGDADVNVRNGKDLTLLHQAIMKEDSTTALFLLDHGADINAK